jgi:amidase
MPVPFKQLSTWQETAKQMQEHRDETIAAIEPKLPDIPSELPLNVANIPKEILTERELELTESPPEDLITVLATGYVSSVEVTKAFLRRAALAQKLVRLPIMNTNVKKYRTDLNRTDKLCDRAPS